MLGRYGGLFGDLGGAAGGTISTYGHMPKSLHAANMKSM
jgi:hypothetical protein